MLLGIPPMLSIPYLNGRNTLRLRWLGPRSDRASIEWAFPCGALGVRSLHPAVFRGDTGPSGPLFPANRMTHKPKLVAVTDCSRRAGASTLAGGLAAALSETGDGKVLLVDMNVGTSGGPPILPRHTRMLAC